MQQYKSARSIKPSGLISLYMGSTYKFKSNSKAGVIGRLLLGPRRKNTYDECTTESQASLDTVRLIRILVLHVRSRSLLLFFISGIFNNVGH